MKIKDLFEKKENKTEDDPCWKGYKQLGMKKKNGKEVPNCIPESKGKTGEYEGRTVELEKPFREKEGNHKFAVYVKNKKGNVIKVRFGDANMEIKRDDPERLKAFRARFKCDSLKDKTSAAYWSCQMWRADKTVSQILDEEDSEK